MQLSRDPNIRVQSFAGCGQTMLEQVGAKYLLKQDSKQPNGCFSCWLDLFVSFI